MDGTTNAAGKTPPAPQQRERLKHRGLLASRKYPIVYLNMPKAACTSVKNLMYRIDTGEDYPSPLSIHDDRNFLLTVMGDEEPAFWDAIARRRIAFTFVKEPFARCYSAFNEKIYGRGPNSFHKYRRAISQEFGGRFSDPGEGTSRELHAANFMAFLKFIVLNIAEQTRLHPNPHWIDQKSLIDSYKRVCTVDLVGRVEQFGIGMEYVLKVGGYRGDVDVNARFNEGPKPPYTLTDIMTPEMHALLHRLYDGDMAEFGYNCPHCGKQGRSKGR